jgi:L-alanine-DL-glutamate epimerase-like enolase superfamily enzyme
MKTQITRVTATPLNVPLHVTLAGADRRTSLACVHVEVETAEFIGHGLTAITEEDVIAQIVNGVAGPAIVGDDALAHEAIWEKLYWKTMPRGQTGYAAHAVAAIDLALWDIKGKALGQPVWRLLGGARNRVPVYATFGFGFFDREQLGSAAKLWVAQGFSRLKMTVGNEALRRRDQRALHDVITEDAARVAAVRDAVGPEVELFVDANCNLDLYHATQLAAMIKPLGIGFFEEPLTQNDVHQMAELRRNAGIPLACGQNEGLLFRFRDLLINKSADILQPNVCISGGITQCLKVAGARGGVQHDDRERRRLAVPQHAPACRPRERRDGRIPLSGGRAVSRTLSRPAQAGGRLAHLARDARPRLRAGSRRDPRDCETPALRRQRQGVTDRASCAILPSGRRRRRKAA